jgi:hypothetical protein
MWTGTFVSVSFQQCTAMRAIDGLHRTVCWEIYAAGRRVQTSPLPPELSTSRLSVREYVTLFIAADSMRISSLHVTAPLSILD